MFLKNAWYVAAWDNEVTDAPLGRTLLNEPVVLFRDANGMAVALQDRCCHRGAPLSLGKVTDAGIQCGYHGLVFDPSGACVSVPGQSRIPPNAEVKSYPVVERLHWIWIWMGDPALADDTLIPDWAFMDDPDWTLVKGNEGAPLPTKCDYEMVTDNLLDLSHLSFVHTSTIGNDEITRFPVKTERIEHGVRMTRLMPEVEPPPFYKMAGNFSGNVDRWQVVEALLPCLIDVDVGCAEAEVKALEKDRPAGGTHFHAVQAPTPETETTCHFFYGHARAFRTDDAEMDEIYRRDFRKVFMEDVVIMEAQQANQQAFPDEEWIDINVDAPGIAMRSLIQERIAAENQNENENNAVEAAE